MPFDCRHRAAHGQDACVTSCLTSGPDATGIFARVERDSALPAIADETVDVALLDMHHGWPNLGHDAMVYGIQNIVCDLTPALRAAGMRVRVTSYDVRRGLRIPEAPGARHVLYVGTGGPGHLDPRLNDGVAEGSQGIKEDAAWEPRLFELFDAIRADDEAAMFAVCHTFGVVCRWLGIADAVLRGPGKGGKSSGVVENVLTEEARVHPWFGRLSRELPDRRHFRVLDSRLYDLIPHGPIAAGLVALSHEALGPAGPEGEALTGLEVARASGGMPRILGVNHHPEIVNRPRQLTNLKKRRERGAVTDEWYEERVHALSETIFDPRGEYWLNLTSSYLFHGPLRFHLYRQIRRRAEALGRSIDVDETRLPLVAEGSGVSLQ
jgi:hypothetical protein